MEIILHTTIKKYDTHYKKALDEYIKRTLPFCRVNLKTYKNLHNISFKNNSFIINVCPGNSTISSPELSKLIQDINLKGISCIEFVLSNQQQLMESIASQHSLNISSFNMSEELTTVVLAEQIYRAYTILNNITYHK